MQNINKVRNYIISRIFGLILILLFVFTSISLFTFSEAYPFYGNWVSTDNINNNAGIWGSYFSGTANTFLSYTSYFFPVFFLTTGIKKIFGIKTNFIIIKYFWTRHDNFESISQENFCVLNFATMELKIGSW